MSISGTKDKPSDDKTSRTTFGPLFRFQGKLADKATGFAQLNLNFGGGSSESKDSYINQTTGTLVQYTRKDKFSLLGLALTPGVNYQIKKHFFLDFRYGLLGYTSVNNKPDDTENKDVKDYKSSEFEIKIDLSTLRLGALFMF